MEAGWGLGGGCLDQLAPTKMGLPLKLPALTCPRLIFSKKVGGGNPKHAGICHLGMGKNGEKWGKMGQIKNFEIHV